MACPRRRSRRVSENDVSQRDRFFKVSASWITTSQANEPCYEKRIYVNGPASSADRSRILLILQLPWISKRVTFSLVGRRFNLCSLCWLVNCHCQKYLIEISHCSFLASQCSIFNSQFLFLISYLPLFIP